MTAAPGVRDRGAGDAGPLHHSPAPAVLRDVADAQAALLRVIAIAAAEGPPGAVFTAVTDEASAFLGGVLMSLARYERSGKEQIILAHTGDHLTDGEWFAGTGADTISARMWTSRGPERIDDVMAVPDPEPRFDRRGVRACVAVPVFVEGELWGGLSSTSRTGPLPPGAEDRLTLFAETVAPAIEIAAARVTMRVLADEQAALLRVAALVARGAAEAAVFEAVTAEAANLIDHEPTTLVRYEGDRTFTVLATRGGPAGPGTQVVVPVDDAGTLAEIMRTRRPARQDRYDTIAHRSSSRHQDDVGSSVSVPIVLHGNLWGALGVLNEGRWLPTETEGRLVKFSELVGSALANAEARAELERSSREQAALRHVAELAASGVPDTVVLRAVVVEASALFDGAVVSVGRDDPAGTWRRLDVAGRRLGDARSLASPPVEAAVAREVLLSGRPRRVEADEGSVPARADGTTPLRGCGVPVRVEAVTWGALVVTAGERPLPDGTEDRLMRFAQVAGTAVTSTRSRATLARLAREQAALRRVAELIARGVPLGEVFDAVATEASNILRGTGVGMFRYDPDGLATIVARHHSPARVGLRVPSAAVGVRESGGAVRFADLAGTAYAHLGRDYGVQGMVAVPIVVEGQTWGGLATTTAGRALPADTEERLTEYAELAAAAVANAENKALLRASRARLVVTADETRQRLQRDVHDGAQQRLVQTVLTLKLGLDLAVRGQDPVQLMQEALEHAERATVELRDLVHGILPASLSRGGLRPGLESLAAGLAVPVDLDLDALPEPRLPSDLEVTAYFIVAEALTNVVKHAGAARARVQVAADAGAGLLAITVTDDGHGGADPQGTGLTGLADRVDALNGSLSLTSPAGLGTTVRVRLPLAGRAAPAAGDGRDDEGGQGPPDHQEPGL